MSVVHFIQKVFRGNVINLSLETFQCHSCLKRWVPETSGSPKSDAQTDGYRGYQLISTWTWFTDAHKLSVTVETHRLYKVGWVEKEMKRAQLYSVTVCYRQEEGRNRVRQCVSMEKLCLCHHGNNRNCHATLSLIIVEWYPSFTDDSLVHENILLQRSKVKGAADGSIKP